MVLQSLICSTVQHTCTCEYLKFAAKMTSLLSRHQREIRKNLTCVSVNGGINTREAKGDTTRHYFAVYFDGETSRDMYWANCNCNVHNFSLQFKVRKG